MRFTRKPTGTLAGQTGRPVRASLGASLADGCVMYGQTSLAHGRGTKQCSALGAMLPLWTPLPERPRALGG